MISGPGLCSPLESGIAAENAQATLQAQFTVNYQPTGASVSMLRSWHYTPPGTPGPWWQRVAAHQADPSQVTIIGNEPPFAGQDNLPAAEAARRVRDDFVGRIGAGAKWVGLNVMFGVESSRRYCRDYHAAGGPEPTWHGVHTYPMTGQELRAWVAEWRGFLASLGWHNAIVLTEVGPRPGGNADAADVLRGAFALWQEGLIAALCWFSSRYPGEWSGGDLLTADGNLTALGELYRRLATVQPAAWFPVARKK